MFHNGLFQQSKLSTSARLNKDGMNRWFVAKPSRHANMKTNHQLINTLPMETKHKPTIHDPFHLFHQPFIVKRKSRRSPDKLLSPNSKLLTPNS